MLEDELPLIAFTVCTPAAAGITFVALLDAIYSLASSGQWVDGWRFAALAIAFTTVGMLASVLHLAKPLRAPRSLMHLSSSWLSREILAVSIFWGMTALWLTCAMIAPGALRGGTAASSPLPYIAAVLCACALVLGIALLFVIARAYGVSGQPGWNGPESLLELFAGAFRVGFPAAACLVFLTTSFRDAIHMPVVSSVLGILGIIVAFWLDSMATSMRSDRLEHELEDGANPHGRVPRAISSVKRWSRERNAAYVVSSVAVVALLAAIVAEGIQLVLIVFAMLCALAAQFMLRAAFYGFCDPGRTVARLPQRRQGVS